MKKLKLIMLLGVGALFMSGNTFGQANPFINVLPSNSGVVPVGGIIDIMVTIGNTGPTSSVAQAKLRPIIQVPPSVTFLPNAQQVGLPTGWTILTNTGSQIRVCNSTDPIAVSTSRTITLKAQGVTVTPPQTFSGNINFGNGTTCSAGTSIAGDLTTDNSATSTIQVVPPVTLNLKCYIEGFYIGGGMMNSVLSNQGLSNPTTTCDTITVELHNATSPYGLAYSYTGVLQTNGMFTCNFPAGSLGNSYYLVVNHRNAMQTWSANPITISLVTSYDFSTNSTQAYGGNQANVGGGVWAFFSGDINNDLSVDAFDYLVMDPDIYNGNGGYLSTDLNGDGSVDAFDYIVYDPNGYNGITVQSP